MSKKRSRVGRAARKGGQPGGRDYEGVWGEHKGPWASLGDKNSCSTKHPRPLSETPAVKENGTREVRQGPGALQPPGCVKGQLNWAQICAGHKNTDGIKK